MSIPAFLQRQAHTDPGRLAPSHSPAHIRASAHLHGVESVPLGKARVLAIGCGRGEGLLPFAVAYPGAQVVGIDADPAAIELAREAAATLEVNNAVFYHCGYGELDEGFAPFDYVIVSGLYSYLPADDAQALLNFCGRVLSPLGILYVDYHVYPGAKAFEVVRDAVLLHGHAAQTEAEVKVAAQAALTLFTDGIASVNPFASALNATAKRLEGHLNDPTVTAPNPLTINPCYFVEFAGQAVQAGLAYAGDTQPLSEIALGFGAGVSLSNSLLTMGQTPVLKQQYLDFATGRGFRQSLWISDRRATAEPFRFDIARFKDLRWASGLQRLAGGDASGTVTYVNQCGQALATAQQSVQIVVDTLAHVWPSSLPYTTVLACVMVRQGLDDAAGRKLLDKALQTLLENGVAHYCLDPSPYDIAAGGALRIVPSVKTLSPPGEALTAGFNFWHEPVKLQLTEIQQALAAAMTAQVPLAALATLAAPHSKNASAFGLSAGTPDVAEFLHLLKRFGLLQSSANTWLVWLRDGLAAASGQAPYCGLYVSALARTCLEAGVLCGNDNSPPPPNALLNQANRMQEFMRENAYQEAETIARKLTQAMPGFIDAWEVLTACLFNTNQLEAAMLAAMQMLQRAPADMRGYVLIGICLARMERTSEAINASRRAVELSPASAHAHSALGDALSAERRYKEARIAYENALTKNPAHRKSRLNLTKVLIDAGDIVAAEKAARDAVAAYPDSTTGYSNLLFATNYAPDKSASEVFQAYQECDRRLFSHLKEKWRRHSNPATWDRRLKIGYVSPDLKKHSGNHFIEPLFAHHDRSRFEITAYAELASEDHVTARMKSYFDHWVPTSRLTDADLAERIRADGIDVLIDVAGHTQGNRLGVFARKPAPVSLTWLGFGYTTGLSAIDYIMTDADMAPVGSEALFAEKPWRLKQSNFVYRAVQDMGPPGDLPALRNGVVTLGTLSRAIRMNHRTIGVWSEILRRLPNARLVVDSNSYRDRHMCESLAARFAAHGIGPQQLSIGYHSPPWDVLRGIDIGLDCFPHNSGVTLVETLYMGVPYVTLADRPSVGRIGSSVLQAIGRPEWIAQTEADYIDKVVALASDIPALARIRAGLREEMHASPLMDEPAFARKFEGALREMFKNWCETQA